MGKINNYHNFDLPPIVEEVLEKIFEDNPRVDLEKQFSKGFTPAHVYEAIPFKNEVIHQLPVVVKVAPKEMIENEEKAFREHISEILPGACPILDQNIEHSDDGTWAGIKYGEPENGFIEVESLHDYLKKYLDQEADKSDEIELLFEEQLFKKLVVLWKPTRGRPRAFFRNYYNPALTVNAEIEFIPAASLPPETQVIELTPENITNHTFKRGEHIRLKGFNDFTVRRDAKIMIRHWQYRLRIVMNEQQEYIEATQEIVGQVRKTQMELLQERADAAFEGVGVDLSKKRISPLAWQHTTTSLPNPLKRLPDILYRTPINLILANAVHGDLNMENILVDPKRNFVYFIDFADARELDHALHDLLRLETGIITWLLPSVLSENKRLPEHIFTLYEQLYWADEYHELPESGGESSKWKKIYRLLHLIRRAAREYNLLDDKGWEEYYHGLTIYLLGSLKFGNLDAKTKQVAFWGAAALQQFLDQPPPRPVHTPPNRRLCDRYEIYEDQVLGRGGMGVVYKGIDDKEKRFVAIKESTRSLSLKKEADQMKELKHKNLPKFIDYCVKDDKDYLVMEFIEGNSLWSQIPKPDSK